jgi:hypothetical protein
MPLMSIEVQGPNLLKAMTALNAAEVATIAEGEHFDDEPPAGWAPSALRAVLDSQDEKDATERVAAALPPDGAYELGAPEPFPISD